MAPPVIDSYVANALFAMFFRVGFPEVLLSYPDPQFTGKLKKEMLEQLTIQDVTTSPYHPAYNGMVEHLIGMFMSMLWKLADGQPYASGTNVYQHLSLPIMKFPRVVLDSHHLNCSMVAKYLDSWKP